MKPFFTLFIAVSIGVGHLWPTSHAGALAPQVKVISPAQLNRAKQIFKESCAKCHGADGRGQTVMGGVLEIPDFTDKAWWKDVEDERLKESVRNGKGGMPRFGKKLSADQIDLLVAYVRRFDKSSR